MRRKQYAVSGCDQPNIASFMVCQSFDCWWGARESKVKGKQLGGVQVEEEREERFGQAGKENK